jgi:hypothetical protein
VATVTPEYALNKKLTWNSDNPGVATVDAEGLVMAVGEGSATITVTTEDGDKTAACLVYVDYQMGIDGNDIRIPRFIISPDPQSGEVYFTYELEKVSQVNIGIYNTNGELVKAYNHDLMAGMHKVKMKREELFPGIYIVRFSLDKFVFTDKMLVR